MDTLVRFIEHDDNLVLSIEYNKKYNHLIVIPREGETFTYNDLEYAVQGVTYRYDLLHLEDALTVDVLLSEIDYSI